MFVRARNAARRVAHALGMILKRKTINLFRNPGTKCLFPLANAATAAFAQTWASMTEKPIASGSIDFLTRLTISVLTNPGSTTVTSMPSGLHSSKSDKPSVVTNAFDALYDALYGAGRAVKLLIEIIPPLFFLAPSLLSSAEERRRFANALPTTCATRVWAMTLRASSES